MISSGFIKRGLASSAIAALAVAGVPALAGTAHAAPGTVTVQAYAAYDIDEFSQGAADDIVVTVLETNGQPSPAGTAIQYDYTFTPEGGGNPVSVTGQAGGSVAGNAGKANLTFDPANGAGTYVVTVKTVGSLIAAAPFTIQVGEAELYWADGASASSPVNGSDTYKGSLLLTNAAKSPLVERDIVIEYDQNGGDANFPAQTFPTVRVDADSATSTTGADGSFSVSLTDPPVTPPATPQTETGTLEAFSPDAVGAGDAANADATDTVAVTFEPAPVVKSVTIAKKNVFADAAPGKPVELDITVKSEGPTAADGDDIVLKDVPVTVTVDKGFLTPDTKGAGLNVATADLQLTAEQDDEGDLFGFYESLGASTTVDTSDDAPANAAAVLATIEKDADFADDGLATQTVTVTAGGKSATTTIDYDSSSYLNLPAAAFFRDSGVSKVGNKVELKLFAADQYGNLVGGEQANVTDNTPDARVDAENGGVRTDFVNDNPSVTATSNKVVEQVITANIGAHKTLVNNLGAPVQSNSTTTATYSIKWTKGGKPAVTATLTGKGGAKDRLSVSTSPKAKNATVTLYKIVKGKKKQIGQKSLNNKGKANFTKKDLNGKKVTKYFVKVAATSTTKGKRSATVKVK